MSDSDEFVGEYLVECNANMALISKHLPALDVAELHRAFHTIKGSSACFGFDRTSAVAYVGEEALSRIRDGAQAPPSLASDLLQLWQRLRQGLDLIAQTGAEPDSPQEPLALESAKATRVSRAAAAETIPKAMERPRASLRRKVSIVDDAPSVRSYLNQILEDEFECACFADGPSALAAAVLERPDVVVSDLMMEPMDGYELCRRFRAQPEFSETRFILLTSTTDPDGRAQGLEQGADDYLSKPLRPRELLARVRSLLRLQEAREEVLKKNEALALAHGKLLQLQQQLVEAERLAAIGGVAAGVAHEINNPLGFIKSGAQHLIGSVRSLAGAANPSKSDRADALEDAEDIERDLLKGIDRIAAITEGLRKLGSPDAPPVSVEVESEIDQAISILGPKLSGVVVSKHIAPGRPVCQPAGCLTQILMNLLSNAVDAAPTAGGQIQVRTRYERDGVELLVEDNGVGIPPAVLGRIFEPFFTTKTAGKGAGLGLSVCLTLVTRLGGEIQVTSESGKGTRARVWVPLQPPDAGARFHLARAVGAAGAKVQQRAGAGR
jgi:two-component system NtrC family sensor kinase